MAIGETLDCTLASAPSTATLHEAAGRRGALPSHLKPIDPAMRLLGPALPVRCPAGDNLWIHRALAEAKTGDVLVIDCGPGDEFGYWGEIMATAAIARGIAGLVITGGVRDSLALIALGLPTFAGRVCIQGTGKDPAGDGAVGETIRVGGVAVRTGDLVVGDADGVLILPAEEGDRVLAAGRERDRKEESILEKVRAGALTLDVYNL
ncbi:RraA family protein [Novosphingobium sp.]|uniref:RraA family protein n=1 Tax=Novosphingobium sp. TaxID=1874826 RepID=UPI002B4A6FF0|nr:RraA family protein [Novosphingobium sp.]HKR93486.1 RraA family protein [Novosphingobium sp.]